MQDPKIEEARSIVVVGAGFAGLEVAKALGRAGVRVTIIDRHNHHLFQPLLYQVATAALSAPDIAEPIRRIVRRYPSVHVIYGSVERIDKSTREVILDDGSKVPYTKLVLAAGARASYFGNDSWQVHAPGLKSITDAQVIRSRLLLAFEKAERADSVDEQHRLMTIAVIGGGPTGVEMAGSIAELARYTLSRDFRRIHPQDARVILIERGDRLLSAFSEDLASYANRRLERLGVDIRTGTSVTDVGAYAIELDGKQTPVGLTIWAAGVAASEIAIGIGANTDRSGRLLVESNLRVVGEQDIYAAGDVANFKDADGNPLPGLAQVAKQQGSHLGKELAACRQAGRTPKPFIYRSRGNTAIIGRHAAVYEYNGLKIRGWFAWIGWAVIHVYLLVGFQHRLTVSIQWLWRYLTYDRGARLIRREE